MTCDILSYWRARPAATPGAHTLMATSPWHLDEHPTLVALTREPTHSLSKDTAIFPDINMISWLGTMLIILFSPFISYAILTTLIYLA